MCVILIYKILLKKTYNLIHSKYNMLTIRQDKKRFSNKKSIYCNILFKKYT